MHEVPELCYMHLTACKSATGADELCPQVGSSALKSVEIVQVASVTDQSQSCLALGLNSLVVAPEWLGCDYEGL